MASNLSSLISDAFTIYSEAYIKIGRIGLKVAEKKGSPVQPKLWDELVFATRLYRVIEPSIILNDDGDAIEEVVGDIDTINNLLLKLKRSVKLFNAIAFPTPLTEFVFNFGSGGDTDATYVTAVLEGGLPNSRKMTQGNGISVVDNGPQGNIVITNTAAIDSTGISMSSSPINLDLNSLTERWFYGTTDITGLRTFTKSNDSNARKLKIRFTISGLTPGGSTHDITFWANTKSSDGRWLSGNKWRPIEDGEYTAEAWTFDGINWIIAFSDKIS